MKRHAGWSARFQYWGIRSITFLLQAFPLDLNLRTARFLGKLWWKFDDRHRLLAIDNLQKSFPDETDRAVLEKLSLRCFQHWAMFAVEFLSAFHRLNEWSWSRHMTPVNYQETLKYLMTKGGMILLTGHYGNFELTAYMLAAMGFETAAIMRPLDNVYFNDYVVRTRGRRGLRLWNKFGATAEAEDFLRQGGALGFVADQDAGRKGVFVDFFGRPASTYKSIGLLAMHCQVPIGVGYARRTGTRFHYEVGITRLIMPAEWRDRPDPLRWITQEYTKAIEGVVREDPEQYLWIHRRWKSRPRT